MNKLYILCGLPFSGKTVLSKIIVNYLEFEHIDLDEVKFEFGYKNVDNDNVPN